MARRRLAALALVVVILAGIGLAFSRAQAANTRPEVVLAADSPALKTVVDFITAFIAGDYSTYSRFLDVGMTGTQVAHYTFPRYRTFVKGLGVPPSYEGCLARASELKVNFPAGFGAGVTGPIRKAQVDVSYTLTTQRLGAGGAVVETKRTAIEERYVVSYVWTARSWRISEIVRTREETLEIVANPS